MWESFTIVASSVSNSLRTLFLSHVILLLQSVSNLTNYVSGLLTWHFQNIFLKNSSLETWSYSAIIFRESVKNL